MAPDFLDFIDVELARALRCVDRAAMFARHLDDHLPEGNRGDTARLRQSIRRVQAIRKAIQAAGIHLPALWNIGEREELPDVVIKWEELTVPQIAELGAVDRSTVTRRLQKMQGPIAEKYWAARRSGKPAVFMLEEAQEILRGRGRE